MDNPLIPINTLITRLNEAVADLGVQIQAAVLAARPDDVMSIDGVPQNYIMIAFKLSEDAILSTSEKEQKGFDTEFEQMMSGFDTEPADPEIVKNIKSGFDRVQEMLNDKDWE